MNNKLKIYQIEEQLIVDPTVFFLENTLNVKIPIALRLIINPIEHLATWHDTMRSHTIKFKSYVVGVTNVTIVGTDNTTWTFTPLTRAHYQSIKDSLVPINREFGSDEELRNYYENAHF